MERIAKMTYKSEIFKEILEQFETEDMKLFCIDLLEQRSDINYHIPSSTSMKYHNATQCQPGGQILHELMVSKVMNYLLGLEYLKNKYPKPRQRDCLRIAAIMHDCCKTNGGQYTVHEHPNLGAEFVVNCSVEHDVDIRLKQYIARLIQSHSGEWTTSSRSSTVLLKPETDDQFLVHLCDYLSSRSDIDMIYSQEIKDLVMDNLPEDKKPDPEIYKFLFGKYKGQTFDFVKEVDPGYLDWLYNKADMEIREPLKTLLENYILTGE